MDPTWKIALQIDPLPALLVEGDPALIYFVQRDLLYWETGPVQALWGLPEAVQLLKRQQANGAWRYPGKSFDPRNGTNFRYKYFRG